MRERLFNNLKEDGGDGGKHHERCRGNHSPPPQANQCPAGLGRATATWEEKNLLLPRVVLCGTKYHCGQFRSAVPAVFPPSFSQRGQSELKRKPWYCASTIQQEPKHQCVISTVLVPNPKHSIIQSATKKVNFITARPSAERSSLSQDAGAAPYDLVSPAHTRPGVQVFFQLKQDGNSSFRKDRWACQSFLFGQALWEPHVASGCLWRSWLKIEVWEIIWQCLKLKKCPVSL